MPQVEIDGMSVWVEQSVLEQPPETLVAPGLSVAQLSALGDETIQPVFYPGVLPPQTQPPGPIPPSLMEPPMPPMGAVELSSAPIPTPPVTDLVNVPPGTDLRDLMPATTGAAISNGYAAPQPASAAVAISAILRWLATRAPWVVGPVRTYLSRFAAGAMVRWESLPVIVQNALALVVPAGTMLLIDNLWPDTADVVAPVPGMNGLAPGGVTMVGGIQVVGRWNTNRLDPSRGVWFYRLVDGRLAVQNSRGAWKIWRPKKPIVIYASGARSVPAMLRADAALNRQAKRVDKMLKRRLKRGRKVSTGQAIGSPEPKIVQIRG